MGSTVWGGSDASQVSMTESFPAVVAASTQILAQDTNRKYLSIQNNNAAGKNLRLNMQAAATIVSLKIQPGQAWTPFAVPTDAINAMGELNGAGSDLAANDVVVIVGT